MKEKMKDDKQMEQKKQKHIVRWTPSEVKRAIQSSRLPLKKLKKDVTI